MGFKDSLNEVKEIPGQLNRVSNNVAVLAVAVSFAAIIALAIAAIALGRAYADAD